MEERAEGGPFQAWNGVCSRNNECSGFLDQKESFLARKEEVKSKENEGYHNNSLEECL